MTVAQYISNIVSRVNSGAINPANCEQDGISKQFFYHLLATINNGAPVLGAGTAVIGGVTDAGGMAVSRGVSGARVTSADQSGAVASITDAPTSGQKLVITDIILSSDTALRIDISEETSGTIFESIYMGANSTVNLVTRGKFKLATADKKLQWRTSAAGNVSATTLYYSEA